MVRVLVCGGRQFEDRRHAQCSLDKLHQSAGFTLLIAGGARGADTLACAAGLVVGSTHLPTRNQRMLDEPPAGPRRGVPRRPRNC